VVPKVCLLKSFITVTQEAGSQRVGIANEGFWGIPVKPNTRYRASFYARASEGFSGPLRIAMVSNDGATVHASAQVARVTGSWKKYEAVLTTGAAKPSAENRLVISTGSAGTVWFSMLSLFPPTWNNRPNGNRKDIMQLLADMKPAFLRFPGGNYVEGRTIATRFDWKKTIGDISQRPGHRNDVAVLVVRRHGAAGVSGMVRRPAHGTCAGGLCRLLAGRRARGGGEGPGAIRSRCD
jgi:hypothetical protein